jgi:HEAT repeat protein
MPEVKAMRRFLAVLSVLLYLGFSTDSLFVFGQAPNTQATQESTPPATSSTTSTNPLLILLKSPNAGTRARAARDLGNARDASAISGLTEALSDPSEKVRREVILALAQIHQPESLQALIKATQDPDEESRVLAVQALVGYYTGIIPSPGFSGFVKKNLQRAKAHFNADNTRIDPGVAVDPTVIAALQATLKDTRSVRAAREAAKGLGILVARPAVPDLIQAAHSSDETLSLESLNSLSKIKDKSAGPQLIDLLDSPNKEIKQQTAETTGILRTQPAVPKLQSIFESDADPKDQEKALEGLAYIGDPASEPTFTKALASENKAVRTSAAEGLARIADPKSLSDLEKALATEKDADAKLALECAITAEGKPDYLSTVVNELASRTRADVATSYLIELARTPGFLSKLYPYLQSPNAGVRKGLCTVLMSAGDQASLAQLDRLSHDPNGDVAAEALRAKRVLRARLDTSATAPSGSVP